MYIYIALYDDTFYIYIYIRRISYIHISVSYTCAFVKHININAPGKNTYTKKSKKKILNITLSYLYILFLKKVKNMSV